MNNSQDIHKLLEHPIPTFNILDHGKRKETLIHCFLQRTTVSSSLIHTAHSIVAKNGETYSAIWDFVSYPANVSYPMEKQEVSVIISFQKHTYGNFAIVRQVNQSEKPAEITFLSTYVGL